MKYIIPKNIEYMQDDDILLVDRNILNVRISKIVYNNEPLSESLIFLLQTISKVLDKEYKKKIVVTLVPMSVGNIKKCFSNYKNLPKGTFAKDDKYNTSIIE